MEGGGWRVEGGGWQVMSKVGWRVVRSVVAGCRLERKGKRWGRRHRWRVGWMGGEACVCGQDMKREEHEVPWGPAAPVV